MLYLTVVAAIVLIYLLLLWGKNDDRKKPIGTKNEGDSSLGMESCAIPAARITASSSTDEGPAFFARLNGSKSWCAGSPADCFLEVDLDIAHYVSAVATQGNPIGNHDFVKKYKIQYSTDGMDWEYYKENYKEVLDGNSDYNTPAKRKLEPDIKARYVRFWPTAWFQWPCLRVEIYGRPAPPDKMTENGVVPIRLQSDDKQQGEDENEKITNGEVVPQDNTYTEQPEVKINATVYESDEEKEVAGQEIDLEFLNDEEVTDEDQEGNMKSAEKQNEDKTNESESEEEKEISGQEIDMEALNDIEVVSTDKTTDHLDDRLNVSDGENNTKKELNMDILNDIGVISTGENDVKETTDEISFRALVTSTPAKPKRLDVNKPDQENNNRVLAIKHNDADLKRLMDVKAKLELEADTRRRYGVELRKKKKRVTLEDDPPEYLHLPRRIYDDMWGDSPTSSVSEGLNNQDEKPLIEIQDGGAPLAKHEDDHIEETSDHQTPQAVTIRTVKKITTRIERHVGHNHLHDAHNHGHDHKDSGIVCSTSANVSHDAPADLFLSLNGFYSPAPYAAKASCEHLHPTDPVVQVAMESSFNERVDSMDQINIDALASRRFSGLDLLQSPYDAVSGEDIQRLLAWEDDTLPGWTRMKKSRDYEIFKGTAVDGGPPIIKTVITLKKIAYEEAVRRITDWKIRQEWDRTFDQITFIEESYNFNVLHCSTKNQGLTLAVMDDVDIDEPYHASVWSVADHPDSYSLSTGKPLRYDTMISGLVIRPTQDGFPSTRVTLLCQLKGSVSAPIKGTYLTGNPDRWIDMLKKYSSPKKISVKK